MNITPVEFMAYIVVPIMCTIGFPCLVALVVFCFKISNKVSRLESDYMHMNNRFCGVETKIDKMDNNIEKLLEYANQQKGRRASDASIKSLERPHGPC